MESICIGTKNRTLGDSLILSTLPQKLKAAYPHLKIYTYPRGLNPVVFKGNPAVLGLQRAPLALFGDDCNWGSGHHIQVKEAYFNLPHSEPVKPNLFLETKEILFAENYLERYSRSSLPLCMIHPWGGTWPKVASRKYWEELVQRMQGEVRFWQIGMEGQPSIPGCENFLFLSKSPANARKLFALMDLADAFLGVNSGPMHVARALGIRSLILTAQGSVNKIFENRRKYAYFLKGNNAGGFLYEENFHLETDLLTHDDLIRRSEEFLSRHLVS
ncbi:MAG: hypothetical protein HYX41_06475 [Bdellovibrio sp.]|nr:hypothetical protein [Bdellovibrio sp.]